MVPCRRTCSTIHHPRFHATRAGLLKKEKTPTRQKRPTSVQRPAPEQVDWVKSGIDGVVRDRDEGMAASIAELNEGIQREAH